jgi:hypothetical protein
MKKIVFKNHRKKWAVISKHWAHFGEPSRPSRGDVYNYNKLLLEALPNKKGAEVLVLGSTPEIRELLYKFWLTKKIKVTCADMTREMYEAMSVFVDNRIKDEKFVIANWVTMKFSHKFDVIIGDYVNGNLGAEYKDSFLTNIKFLLKEGGYFIQRDTIISDDFKIPNVEYVFRKFIPEVKLEEYSIKKAANMCANYLIWASWFVAKNNKTSLSYYWPEIEKFGRKIAKAKTENDLLAKAIYERFLLAWIPYKDKYWTYYRTRKNNNLLRRYFSIKKVVSAKDYFSILAKNSPMYLLKKI